MTETTPLIEKLRAYGFNEEADNLQEIHDSPELQVKCHYDPDTTDIDEAFIWAATKQGHHYWDARYWGDTKLWEEEEQDHD